MDKAYKLYISTDEKNFISVDDLFMGITKSIINFKDLNGEDITGGFSLNEFLKVIDANKYGELLKEKVRLKATETEEIGGRRRKSRSKERRPSDKNKDDKKMDDDDEDDVNSYGGDNKSWRTNNYTRLFL